MFLSMFLFFLGFQPGCSYKRSSLKKKGVNKRLDELMSGQEKLCFVNRETLNELMNKRLDG